MKTIIGIYRPFDLHGKDGFYSATLYRDPRPVMVDGKLAHLCDAVETEAISFPSKEQAERYFLGFE